MMMKMKAEGRKDDADKARMDLLAPDALIELGRLAAKGAKKYGDRNWELGMDWGRVYAAAMRHLNAFWSGEDIDAETGVPHTVNAMWCCMVLTSYYLREKGNDSREKLG